MINPGPLQPCKITVAMSFYFPIPVLLARQGCTQERTGEDWQGQGDPSKIGLSKTLTLRGQGGKWGGLLIVFPH